MNTIENNNSHKTIPNRFYLWITILSIFICLNCSKSDESERVNSGYSGTGNFNFTGDYDMNFTGTVENAMIEEITDGQSIALNFVDSQGLAFFIGLRGPKMEARTFTTEDLFSEGYAGIEIEGELYDTGAIGGTGTVTLTKVDNNALNGTVNMKLARPLNTADTLVVTGSFNLIGQ